MKILTAFVFLFVVASASGEQKVGPCVNDCIRRSGDLGRLFRMGDCPHGSICVPNGCGTVCRPRSPRFCPFDEKPLFCDLDCSNSNGYEMNIDGCPICRCKQPSTPSSPGTGTGSSINCPRAACPPIWPYCEYGHNRAPKGCPPCVCLF